MTKRQRLNAAKMLLEVFAGTLSPIKRAELEEKIRAAEAELKLQ